MLRQVTAVGHDAVVAASTLLRRARRADDSAGLWEAADVQWWWRKPRRSDGVEQTFWFDDDGPIAAALLTDFGDGWQCDLLLVSAEMIALQVVWQEAERRLGALGVDEFVIPVHDDDADLVELVTTAGLVPKERDATAWMNVDERPPLAKLADGFGLVDRSAAGGKPHPFRRRNGDGVEARLRECPLYDPTLDLAVETADGQVAGYSLYWFDPATAVGLLEPMRVEERFQRQGLAQAMFGEGADRLATLGAQRLKVSYSTETAAALYEKCGFHQTSTATWYGRPLP